MNNIELKEKLLDIAKNKKTVYLYGGWGQQITTNVINAKAKQYKWFYTNARIKNLKSLVGKGYWGFDCVNLVKGVLWGWTGNTKYVNGGAKYGSNNVPDLSANGLFKKCTNQSTDFSKIEIGEALWMDGHFGIYIGDGLGIECTPKWNNKVQITSVGNIGSKSGYNTRTWTKHGKLPYITYKTPTTNTNTKKETTSSSFLGKKGYFSLGDTHVNIGKIANFMYKTFPAYTNKKALGNYYGNYIYSAIKEFQKRTGLKADGCVGPLTLAKLKKYGFKY